tara:strand:- start:104831 stop:105715 length:885 start_codon:yes stop_codon:yes gene_type:complete
MFISLEQAAAFDAIVEKGTVQKAAESLNKGHSAILYLIRTLESQLDLKLFDRSGYRNKLTTEGQTVLKYCRKMLEAQNDLRAVCKNLQQGWEPSLKIIYDGVVDFDSIGNALFALNEFKAPTEIKLVSAFLGDVESKYETEDADMMVTILPIKRRELQAIPLRQFRMFLVSHPEHSLGKQKSRKIEIKELEDHTYIRVGAASHPIGLSTDRIDFSSYFYVNDFHTKKQAILKKLGFGWLPEYMVKTELKNKSLKILTTEIQNTALFHPKLFHRRTELVGKMGQHLLKAFRFQDS